MKDECPLFFAVPFSSPNTAKLPAYAGVSMFNAPTLRLSLMLSPLVVFGAGLGLWVNRKMNDVLFGKIVYAVTFVLGWYLAIIAGRELWVMGV